MNTIFDGYAPYKGDISYRKQGSLIAFEAGESVTYGLFRLINALSHLGGTGGHQASSSSLSKNGKGLWDDSLDAAEEEERQKKNQNSIRM